MPALSYAEVCTKFAEMAKEQKMRYFDKETPEEVAEYLLNYGIPFGCTEKYLYTVDPAEFMKSAYKQLRIDSPPLIKTIVDAGRQPWELTTDKVTSMFFEAFLIYIFRCRIHESLAETVFDEALNFFVKVSDPKKSPYEGPFERVPSTFFGGEQLSIWDMDFPPEYDMALVYTNEGFLRTILKYKGKSVMHYS